MEADCPGCRALAASCRELTKQRDDHKYDAEALRDKLKILQRELQARLERTPRARAFLATLLQVVRD